MRKDDRSSYFHREDSLGIYSWWSEAKDLLYLSIPTIIIHLSFVVPSFLAASYIGRNFGHLYLDGYALANLTSNIFQGTILQGLFNASDTLSPQAFGAGNHREVGLLAIRGFIACLFVIIPINAVLFLLMDKILVFFGQDAEASNLSWHFYMIYALGFPFYALFSIVWKFLSAQGILAPLVVSTLAATLVVLPLSLEICIQNMGFLGAALAIAIFYMFQSVTVITWIWIKQPHHPDSWPGLGAEVWQEALAWGPFRHYLALGVGGMLSYLEWVYWEALSLMIGSLGVIPLSAHTIPTQVLDFAFMFPLGVGIALAIRMGHTISQDATRAKFQAFGTLVFSFITFGIGSIALYVYRDAIINIFTTESAVIELCHAIWFHVCFYFFVLGVFGIVIGIAIGLGMQWSLGIVTVVSLWVIGMPAAYYFAVVREGGLVAVWTCIWPPYVLINLWMVVAFVTKDWDEIRTSIRKREGVDNDANALESSSLLGGGVDRCYGAEIIADF